MIPNVCIRQVRSNVSGSTYNVYDQGLKPSKAVTSASLRRELAAVFFDYDKMGPGKMHACLPAPNVVWKVGDQI